MGILCFFNDVVVRLILPFLLENLLSYFRYVHSNSSIRHTGAITIFSFLFSKNSEISQNDALISGSSIFVITIVSGIALLHYFYFGFYYGMRVRIATTSLIYRKVCSECVSTSIPTFYDY